MTDNTNLIQEIATDIANNPTIFGKILRGEIPCNKVYEDELILAFHDINPRRKIHVVAIPKLLIKDLREATPQHQEILGHLMIKIPEIAKNAELTEGGFRIIANNGEDANQEVPHLHFHLLGGEKVGAIVND